MELPKNITQIGESERNCKIYVEDYVISYIKQLNQSARDKDMAVALYGIKKEEKETRYFFLYGACKLDFLQKESRHLSQAQQQEIEKLRKKYFPEYRFLGYRLLNGEMVEGFHICEQETCRYISGYAQFYEKNDSMLAYMLDTRQEEVKPEEVPLEKYDMVKQRQEERRDSSQDNSRNRRKNGENAGRMQEHRYKPEGSTPVMRKMRISAVAVFALFCVAGLATMGGSDKLESLQAAAKQMVDDMTQQKLPDSVEVMNPEAQVDIIVTEDKLAQALQQENQNAGQNVPPATMMPATEPVPSATTEPVPSATTEPAIESSVSVSAAPITEPAPTITPPVTPIPEPASYTIKQGDTLIGICINRYGSDSKVKEICSLNSISNPDDIKIGEKILLP